MIELGIVLLVKGNAAVTAIAPVGGFFAQLPNDQILPSWTYLGVSQTANYDLKASSSLFMRRLQIDCYGKTAADSIVLAKAIDAVLNGYRGTLTDPDHIFVDGCFQDNLIDYYDPDSRSFRRMLEYQLWFTTS